MSVQAITWAFAVELPEPPRGISKPAMRLALVTLANYADRDGRAWPSLASLEAESCMSGRQLQRVFTVLELTGILKREARRRRNGSRTSNVYVLVIDKVTPRQGGLRTQGDTSSPPEPSLEPEPSLSDEAVAGVQKIGKTPVPPSPVFLELAALDGGFDRMTPQAKKKVGVALAGIKRATPNVSPEEIARRAANYRWLPWNREKAPPSAHALAGHWAECFDDPPGRQPDLGMSPASDPNWIDRIGEADVR